MRILIAISSCQLWEDNGNNQAIRDTWMKDVAAYPNVDCKFFHGRGAEEKSDVVVIDAPDGYEGLGYKTQQIHEWSCSQGYHFTFLCFGDTFVNVRALLNSGFENHQYYGHIHTWPGSPAAKHGFLGGGEGYWMSFHASVALSLAKMDDDAEDRWAGRVMAEHGIVLAHNPEYGKSITKHGSLEMGGKGQYDKSWMYKTYEERE